jgi:chromosome segregation ATPase
MRHEYTEIHSLKSSLAAHEKQLKNAYIHIEHLNEKLKDALKPKTVKEQELKNLQALLSSAQAEVKAMRGINQKLTISDLPSNHSRSISDSQRLDSLRRVQNELLNLLGEAVLTKARYEFYERHIRELDTETLLILLRNMQFVDSLK